MLFHEKRGSIFITSYMGIFLAIFLTALIVDYGSAFTYKVQLQHMADAAVLAGADASKTQMDHPRLGAQAFFMDDEARGEINRLMRINQEFVPQHIGLSSVRINPSGKFGKTTENQFYEGLLTVAWSGYVVPHYLSFFGINSSIQFPASATAQAQITNERTERRPDFLDLPGPMYRGIIHDD